MWYLANPRWPPPNLALLNAAVRQTDPEAEPLTEANWRSAVARRLETASWDSVAADVRPFLERPEAQLLPTRAMLLDLLHPARPSAAVRGVAGPRSGAR